MPAPAKPVHAGNGTRDLPTANVRIEQNDHHAHIRIVREIALN